MHADFLLSRPGLCVLDVRPGVEVWLCRLDFDGYELREFRSALSPEELERAATYGSERLRNLYVGRRGVLRTLLSRLVLKPPESITLREEPGRKPALATGDLRFNLSFSGDHALYAFSRAWNVGVDLEAVAPCFPMAGVARDHFTAAERNLLDEAGAPDRARVFFTFWTRKEACAKALGIGLTDSFACYEVAEPPSAFSVPMRVCNGGRLDERLSVYDLDVGEGFRGALALPV